MPAQYPLRSLDRAVRRQHILRETGHKTVNGPLTMFFRGWRAISGMPGSRFTGSIAIYRSGRCDFAVSKGETIVGKNLMVVRRGWRRVDTGALR